MNTTTDPGKQLINARFLRKELAGEGAGINPINIKYRNPALKETMALYTDGIIDENPDPGFAKAKTDYLQGLDTMIADAEAKEAKGEAFRLFPPTRAESEETLPNSKSLTGRLFGATKDKPNLGKLAQHEMGNVVDGLEKTKKADQALLQKFTDNCPEN